MMDARIPAAPSPRSIVALQRRPPESKGLSPTSNFHDSDAGPDARRLLNHLSLNQIHPQRMEILRFISKEPGVTSSEVGQFREIFRSRDEGPSLWPRVAAPSNHEENEGQDLHRLDFLSHLAVSVVEDTPGVWVQRAIQILSKEHRVRSETALAVLRHLTDEEIVERRSWGGRHWLFPHRSDLEDWWRQVAALRKEVLRALFDLVAEAPLDCSQICMRARQRFGWPPSTTRDRLKMLARVNLLIPMDGRSGHRNVCYRAATLHPSAADALR